ncbi:MAG: hypothetical protein AAFV53_25730 [Myxococcota bacterium]
MLLPSMRPPFIERVPFSVSETTDRLAAGFAVAQCPCEGTVSSAHVSVSICTRERRFFSPTLDLEISGDGSGALLSGRFGPHPDTWTLYVAAYATLTFLCLGSGVMAISQFTLGSPMTALWAWAIAGPLFAGLYVSALLGQRLAADQMQLLEAFLMDNLNLSISAPQAGGRR